MRFLKSFVYIQFTICFIFISLAYSVPVGKFTYVEGRVDLTPPGKKAIPVKLGMPVSMGDVIRTKSKSKAEITFNDGNILRLAQNTKVEITQYIVGTKKSFRILGLYRGNIQNIVKKTIASKIARFIKAHKYEVHTPIAVVGVKGTVFFTFHTKLGSGAIFKEGVGYCYAKKLPQKIVYIHAGQKVFVASPTTVPVVKRATKTELKKFETETSPKKEGRKKGTSSIEGQEGKKEKKEKKKAFSKKGSGKIIQKTAVQRKIIETTTEFTKTATTSFTSSVATENEVYIPITEAEKERSIIFITSSEKQSKVPSQEQVSEEETPPQEQVFEEETPPQEEVSGEETTPQEQVPGEETPPGNGGNTSGGDGGGPSDTTPPSVSIKIVPASESNKSKIEITTDEPATLSWNLDGSRSGSSNTIEDVDEGSHTLSVSAEDEAGNRTNEVYSFDIKRYSLRNYGTGTINISGSGSRYSGLILGEVAASIDDDKGSWKISGNGTYSGQHSDSWQLNGGSYSVDSSDNWNGYYFYEASGTYSGPEMYGTSYLRVLTKKTYGEGWGDFHGSYDAENSTWQGESSGDYECKSLEYSGELSWSDDWSKGPYSNLFGDDGSGGFIVVGDLSSPLIGGLTTPWNTLPSEFYIIGGYSIENSSYTAPYIWTANLYSKNWDSSQYTTYDNGAFYGFAGGIWLNNGEIRGGTVALYISPDKEIGFIRGNIEEADECEDSYTLFENTGMFTTDGEWWKLEKKADSSLESSNFYKLVKTHSNIDFKMDANFYDENGVESGLIKGISYLFDTNNEGGWTRYLDGEKWGIFNIIIYGYEPQSFQNPNNLTSWSGAIGGDAYFGTYYNGSSYIDDYGYWIAWVGGNIDIYEDSELYGHISGNFLTLTKMGYISGDIYGYYNGDKWAGTALGVYEADKDIVFSSCIGLYDIPKGKLFALTEGSLNYGRYYNQDQEYYYEYSTDGLGIGYSAYYPDINKKYYSNGKMVKYEYGASNGYSPPDNPPDISLEDWDVSDLSELGNLPGWTKDDSASGTRTINLLDSAGEFSLILGGYVPEEGTPASLWEATDNPMPIYLIGQISSIEDAYKDKPLIFHSEIRSINPHDLTYTTPDKGAYVGFIGGVLSISQTTDGGWWESVDGKMVGLYIAPNQSSGIIDGWFGGLAYRGISMWEGWGDVWIEQKEQSISISPSELINSVSYHFIDASIYGKFTQGENYAMGLGLGQTLFINNMNWGVYYILFGSEDYYNTTQFGDFQGKIGGMGYFGSEGIGFWLANVGPYWDPQDKVISGNISGKYLTLQGEGTILGNMYGSYEENNENKWWQAELLGIWEADENMRFKFSSWIGDYIYLYDGEWKKIGEIEGIMGGLDELSQATADNPAWLSFLGRYYIKESAGNFKYSLISSDIRNYSTDNTDLYRGFFTGIIGLTPDTNLVEGNIYCLYKDPTTNLPGILVGDFSGSSYFHIGMWKAGGGISPVKELSSSWPTGLGLDDITPNIHSNLTVSSDGDIWVSQYDTYSLWIPDEPWYIWMDKISGSYSSSPSDNWISYVYYNFDNPDISKDTWEHVLSGTKWSDDIAKADISGAWVSWKDAVTGVSGGKLIGTFEPSTIPIKWITAPMWQAVASGVSMTTEKFLQMVQNGEIDKLQQLNIPCFEIGRTTLTGSNGNISVTMQDVIFFARQSGGVPRIWATNNVSGSFTTQPNINDSVSLQSQSGDTAQFNDVEFKVIKWQDSKWGAIVESKNAGTVGIDPNKYENIHMKGAAAGNFDSSSFWGTASGIAKQQ